jgi:predicted anti-sigma-YlaC factor YlaD
MPQEQCLDTEQLSLLIDGRLDGEAIRALTGHLKSCDTCRAHLNNLNQLKSALRCLHTPSSPPKPDFWTDAFRNARIEAQKHSTYNGPFDLRAVFTRQVVTAITVVTIVATVFVPLATGRYLQTASEVPKDSTAANTVDVNSLLQAHTSYTSVQPLADDYRVSMILSDEATAKELMPRDDQSTVGSP